MDVRRTAIGWRRRAVFWSVTASVKCPRIELVRIIMLNDFDIDEYVYSAVRASERFLLKRPPPSSAGGDSVRCTAAMQ